MDLTSALMAYDHEMEQARLEKREPTTAEKIHALRAAIEAYEKEKTKTTKDKE